MRRSCLALLALLVPALASAQSAPDFGAVDALLRDSLVQIGGGAVVRVVRADTVVFERAYGTFALDESVEIASASKWLSGAVLLSLADSGELSLDDPLSRFFPDLTGLKRTITIRQLFALTSGITGNAGSTCINEASATLAVCADEILAKPLAYQPGSGFLYGGASMHVAARAAEIATGRSWADLFEERIAGPLEMTQTTYLSATNPWVAGGLVSSAPDYTAFLQMVAGGGVYRGERVLSEASVDAMLADQSGVESGDVPVLFTPFSRYAGGDPDIPTDEVGYGVGVWREQLGASGALRHASSLGAYGFSPWVDVERELGGALVVLDDGPDVFWTYLELKRRIEAALDKAVPTTAGETPPMDPAPRIEGVWPNPIRQSGQVAFEVAKSAHARLALIDALGREVAVLADELFGAGRHVVPFSARGLAAGTYLAVLRAGDTRAVRRVTVQ